MSKKERKYSIILPQREQSRKEKKNLARFCRTGRISGVLLGALSDHVITRAQG
jgi:hypothetical protein